MSFRPIYLLIFNSPLGIAECIEETFFLNYTGCPKNLTLKLTTLSIDLLLCYFIRLNASKSDGKLQMLSRT